MSSEEGDDQSNGGNNDSSNTSGANLMRVAGLGGAKTNKELEIMMVKKTVSKHTILYCPFVNNSRELALTSPFAKITLGFLGKNKEAENTRSKFWDEHKVIAHEALNVKRSNISGQLRKHFIGRNSKYFHFQNLFTTNPFLYAFLIAHIRKLAENEDEDGGINEFPSLEDVMKVRTKPKTWCHIIARFVKFVVPEARDYIASRPFHEWCPISTEAPLFVMIENSYDLWMEEATNTDETETKDLTSRAKWTERKGSGRKFGGWGNEGIVRFNEMHAKIKRARDTKSSNKDLEKKLETIAKGMGLERTKRKLADLQDGAEPSFDMPDTFEAV